MVSEDSMSILDATTEIRTIRSHRAPKVRKAHRWVSAVAAVAALTAGFALPGGSAVPKANADAPSAIHAVVVAPLPPRTEATATSRSLLVRKASKAASRSTRINKVINYAMAQRGDRYRFGAAGPNKWDCSGLVVKSYAKIGVRLPHFTGDLLHKGKRVSHKNLKRGDLVFPSSHHVGIYIGNGKMIVASSGHGKVMVQPVYAFYTARRIV